MTDNEKIIYIQLSDNLKQVYPNIEIKNQKLPIDQTIFPAASIVLTNNEVISEYSTFDQIETVTKETFEFEVADSQEAGMDNVKEILNIIDEEMSKLNYQRSYIGPVEDKEIIDVRRMARYQKLITELVPLVKMVKMHLQLKLKTYYQN